MAYLSGNTAVSQSYGNVDEWWLKIFFAFFRHFFATKLRWRVLRRKDSCLATTITYNPWYKRRF